jgi:hypothetical protein
MDYRAENQKTIMTSVLIITMDQIWAMNYRDIANASCGTN